MSTLAQDTQAAEQTPLCSAFLAVTHVECVFLVPLMGLFYSVCCYFITSALNETNHCLMWWLHLCYHMAPNVVSMCNMKKIVVFFWHGATVFRLMWPLISPRETKNQEIKKKAVTDFLLTNIFIDNGDSLKMIVYKRLEKRLQVIHLLGDHFIDWRCCNVAKMQPGK